jgi:hypothetical protein
MDPSETIVQTRKDADLDTELQHHRSQSLSSKTGECITRLWQATQTCRCPKTGPSAKKY